MHAVLATFLAMASGTSHNLTRPLPELSELVPFSGSTPSPALYAYDQDHCRTRRSGVIICPRYVR
ncbi:hypothetical protein P7D22_11020 [Lichenihabitans sp. Uapishka_5]|uniref:hypothetical protein n=1 Tax=Lichenihabitans sp. Uapishka_5 TaxID=3037302 RepID=UPI0029E7F562|nr:hypothetical protein [Lichenihabitans sp. Uapishka_5]MDX7951698.1 hypothetical protein [Lichenihabitans sp. Uapishka_5]